MARLRGSNPYLRFWRSTFCQLNYRRIGHRRLVTVYLHVSETLVRQFSPFINKALPILIQGFGASLALISFLTVDDSHTTLPAPWPYLKTILRNTTLVDLNHTSRPVKLGALPLKLPRGYINIGVELSAKTHHFMQAYAPRSFRLVTLVVISPRPCSATTTCDSVCVHTTATNIFMGWTRRFELPIFRATI